MIATASAAALSPLSASDRLTLQAFRVALQDVRDARAARDAAEAAANTAGRALLRSYCLTVDVDFAGAGSRILDPEQMPEAVDGVAADAMYADWWADGLSEFVEARRDAEQAEQALADAYGASALRVASLPADLDAWEAQAFLELTGRVAA